MNREKKKTRPALSALLIAAVLSAVMCAVEGICAFAAGSMPVSIPSYGGECTVYEGIGWSILKTYPMTASPELDAAMSSTEVSFSPVGLILFFALVWLIAFTAVRMINRAKKNRAQ